MHLDDALAFVAADVCLRVHDVLPNLTKNVDLSMGALRDDDHTTWLVKGAQLFTLIKHARQTLVYCHANAQLYHASPEMALAESCPDNHAFLGQAVEDAEGGGVKPRLLVFDVSHPAEQDPRRRGETLRSLSHAFPPACHVQWAGLLKSLKAFLAKTKLPHEVDAALALRGSMQLVRELGTDGGRAAKRRRTTRAKVE